MMVPISTRRRHGKAMMIPWGTVMGRDHSNIFRMSSGGRVLHMWRVVRRRRVMISSIIERTRKSVGNWVRWSATIVVRRVPIRSRGLNMRRRSSTHGPRTDGVGGTEDILTRTLHHRRFPMAVHNDFDSFVIIGRRRPTTRISRCLRPGMMIHRLGYRFQYFCRHCQSICCRYRNSVGGESYCGSMLP